MLDALGNLGDFIGSIAVVVSLVYLASQIRRNTLSIQAATIQSATHFTALSQQDRLRFASLMGAMLYRFENLVAQTESGLLPRDSWDGVANRLRETFALPGTLVWWERGKHVFTKQLRGWVDQELIGSQPPSVAQQSAKGASTPDRPGKRTRR